MSSSSIQEQGRDVMEADRADQWKASVSDRLGNRVRNLGLEVRGNSIIVRGNCHSYYAKQLAQHAVMELTGLRILANEIQVK